MSWVPWVEANQGTSQMTLRDVTAEFQDLLARYENEGLEFGWSGVNNPDSDEKRKLVSAAVSAELVLLEQLHHGPLPPSPEGLRATLEDLRRRRAQLGSQDDAVVIGLIEGRPWRFEWKRAGGLAAIGLLAGLTLELLKGGLAWEAWSMIGVAAGLLIIGPWRVADRLARAGMLRRRTVDAILRRLRTSAMDRDIRRVESEIQSSALRRAVADEWVHHRLQLVAQRFEVQRGRAEAAAKVADAAARQRRWQPPRDPGTALRVC
jgi:hypothetical protein